MSLVDYLDNLNVDHLYVIGPFFQGTLPATSALVFVDRGADFRSGGEGFSVGDGDSAKTLLDEKLNPHKDFSDLAYVLEHLPEKIKKISLLGFLGGRKDHELMNLAEVHRLLDRSSGRVVEFDQEIYAYSAGNWDFRHQGLFSAFAFADVSLHLSGDCEYPVRGNLKALSSHGLSNKSWGRVEFSGDAPVFMFLLSDLSDKES